MTESEKVVEKAAMVIHRADGGKGKPCPSCIEVARALLKSGMLGKGVKVKLPKEISWNQATVMMDEKDGTLQGANPGDFQAGWNACREKTLMLNGLSLESRKGKSTRKGSGE